MHRMHQQPKINELTAVHLKHIMNYFCDFMEKISHFNAIRKKFGPFLGTFENI